MAKDTRLLSRPWALGTAVLGFTMLAVYVSLIVAQGGGSLFGMLPWALLMTIAPIAAFAAAQIEDRRLARKIMIVAAALFALLGAVSILSIGIGFLLTSALAAVASVRLSNVKRSNTNSSDI